MGDHLIGAGAVRTRGGRPNRYADWCVICGVHVPPGQGVLAWCEDGAGPVGYCAQHFDEGGWHVVCRDTTACEQRERQKQEAGRLQREQQRKRQEQEAGRLQRERQEQEAERARLLTLIPPHLVEVEEGHPADVSAEWETVGSWEIGDRRGWLRRTPDGLAWVVEETGASGDPRTSLWVLPEVRERIWSELQARRGATPARAKRWLRLNRGCAETAFWEWVAAQDPGAEEEPQVARFSVENDRWLRLEHQGGAITVPLEGTAEETCRQVLSRRLKAREILSLDVQTGEVVFR